MEEEIEEDDDDAGDDDDDDGGDLTLFLSTFVSTVCEISCKEVEWGIPIDAVIASI